MTSLGDPAPFPDPVYAETVLAPLFEGVKAHFAPAMHAIDAAHLVMLAETGILPPAAAGAIARARAAIEAETDLAALCYTGEHEDYFFLVEAELKRRLGPDLGGALHTARSRNDIDHTVFRMGLRARAATLQGQALALAEALLATARRERDTLIVAYTHGQPAQPTTFGHYLGAVIEGLIRDIARLDAAQEALDFCPMGAAAITTSGFPIDRHRVAELLGFAAPLRNSYGCIAGVDYVTGLYSALRLMMLHLGRVVQDMQFWTAFEVGQLHVPDAFVQISSIMPQKRNPVPVEHLRHLASMAAGRAEAVIATMHNTPFTDMNDSEGAVQQAGYAAFEDAGRVLRLMAALLPACRIRPERVAATLQAACVTVTELADHLVRAEGLSFRTAHHIAAATARAVAAAGAPLAEGHAAFATAFAHETGRAPACDAAAFAAIVSPERFVAVRDRFGGPAPAAMDAALAAYAEALAAARAREQARAARHAAADTARADAFAALTLLQE